MSDFRNHLNERELLFSVIKLATVAAASYFTLTWILKKIDPTMNKHKEIAKSNAEKMLKKLGRDKLLPELTEYETLIASHLVCPDDIAVSWQDIAGLENIVSEISETVIFPIVSSKMLSSSQLTRPPKGVLLYGPPGCGKTLIAKATAKEAATSFINLDISMLTDKWYGESQKLVSAVFSLAEKLQPCIIFIDEIDSLLRSRGSQDHEATAMMKAQFMFLWDGLITDNEKVVIVMGATNRPGDLDAAIVRRMPASFRIPMPNAVQRKAILKLILKDEFTDNINYETLTKETDKFSGSDLKELCRIASLYRVREFAKCIRKEASSVSTEKPRESEEQTCSLRAITMDDLRRAIASMKHSKLDHPDFLQQLGEIKLD